VWGVLASLRVPQLFPTAHWTPCKPIEQVRHHGGDKCTYRKSNLERQKETSPHTPLEHDPQAWLFVIVHVIVDGFLFIYGLKFFLIFYFNL